MERFRLFLSLFVLLLRSFCISCALNSEGLALLSFRDRIDSDPYDALASWGGGDDPCSWFGVGCCKGKVVRLNLKDLCLGGTLTPMLGQLSNMKFLILHNNSFSGPIPKEIGQLKKLEILDLGHNNLSGPLPSEIGIIYQLLILSNNRFLEDDLSNFVQEACWNKISATRDTKQIESAAIKRRLMQESPPDGQNVGTSSGSVSTPSPLPSPSPSPSPSSFPPMATPSPTPSPAPSSPPASPPISIPSRPSPKEIPKLSPSSSPSKPEEGSPHRSRKVLWTVYISIAVGVTFLLSITAIFLLFCQKNKVVMVRPWTTGLSGQLQKALVTGVPRLKRVELETACEDFSNIVGSFRDSTLYKGTLSSGVEIAVISSSVMSSKDWSKHLEAQFRKKIETLSKLNHKNFVNLLGYCEEEEPFTRMMVLEYAPNGTLFEHLHVKESEHLDWSMRLRIAMGVAYCLEHMHQRSPPIAHKSLHSAVICLTDDYAAKISDFDFYNVNSAVKMGSGDSGLSEASLLDRESNVYNFGIMLLEMMTGRIAYSENEGPLLTWALDYLNGVQPLRLMMDSTLTSFREEEASALLEVVRSCINPNPMRRPLMREVVNQLREITTIAPDGATPRLSPLWWAELEILSTDGN